MSEARLGNIPHQKGVDGTLAFSVPLTFKGDGLPVEIVIEEETGLFKGNYGDILHNSAGAAGS